MIVIGLLGLMVVGSTGVDYAISLRRIRRLGRLVETNPLLQKLLDRFSPATALAIGCILPTVLVASLAGYFSLVLLALYTGVRLDRAMIQLESIPLEHKIEGYQARLLPALRASVPESVK